MESSSSHLLITQFISLEKNPTNTYQHSQWLLSESPALLITQTYLPRPALLLVLASLVATSLSYGAYKLFLFFYAWWTSPLHFLGPPNASLIFGQMKAIMKIVCISGLFESLSSLDACTLQENSVLRKKWVNKNGSTITFDVRFGVRGYLKHSY